jgi:hypothetical protein
VTWSPRLCQSVPGAPGCAPSGTRCWTTTWTSWRCEPAPTRAGGGVRPEDPLRLVAKPPTDRPSEDLRGAASSAQGLGLMSTEVVAGHFRVGSQPRSGVQPPRPLLSSAWLRVPRCSRHVSPRRAPPRSTAIAATAGRTRSRSSRRCRCAPASGAASPSILVLDRRGRTAPRSSSPVFAAGTRRSSDSRHARRACRVRGSASPPAEPPARSIWSARRHP